MKKIPSVPRKLPKPKEPKPQSRVTVPAKKQLATFVEASQVPKVKRKPKR